MQDDAWSGYSAPGTHVRFDFEKFLRLLTTHHHNYVRIWIVENTRSDKGPVDMLATPMPFLRTGPGNALDGKPKFEFHTTTLPAVNAVQKAYVRKVIDTVIDTVNDLDNVLYEITNESVPQSRGGSTT